jgi:transketolase
MRGDLPAGSRRRRSPPTRKAREEAPKVATRKASEMALEVDQPASVPETLGGSADLTGSNNTRTSQTRDHPGRFLRPLYPLRHPRARHGRGDERHRAAWRI